jgi:hypothetical protein
VTSHQDQFSVGLTLEDEFTLTRIRNQATELSGKARDQYLWNRIYRFVCRERAYKAVADELGVIIDPNIDIFDKEQPG